MPAEELDVVAVGHAIVDVIASAGDDELAALGIAKGTMTLVDAARADALYAAMGPATETSGGSAANTAAGVASFGGAAAFVGKVRDDQLGAVFAHDVRAAGVRYGTPPLTSGEATARCLVMVTPDGERTMSTYLGAATSLAAADVDEALVASAAVTFLEGYLWDPPEAIGALRHAMATAHRAGRKVAFSLSDPFCVARHRGEFLELLDGTVDLLFANGSEALALFEVPTLDEAVGALRRRCPLAVVTLGPAGSLVVTPSAVHQVAAVPVDDVVDTTGAGDLYAAGFLFGLTRGAPLPVCGRLGSAAAAEVIAHIGARPRAPLSEIGAALLAG